MSITNYLSFLIFTPTATNQPTFFPYIQILYKDKDICSVIYCSSYFTHVNNPICLSSLKENCCGMHKKLSHHPWLHFYFSNIHKGLSRNICQQFFYGHFWNLLKSFNLLPSSLHLLSPLVWHFRLVARLPTTRPSPLHLLPLA